MGDTSLFSGKQADLGHRVAWPSPGSVWRSLGAGYSDDRDLLYSPFPSTWRIFIWTRPQICGGTAAALTGAKT